MRKRRWYSNLLGVFHVAVRQRRVCECSTPCSTGKMVVKEEASHLLWMKMNEFAQMQLCCHNDCLDSQINDDFYQARIMTSHYTRLNVSISVAIHLHWAKLDGSTDTVNMGEQLNVLRKWSPSTEIPMLAASCTSVSLLHRRIWQLLVRRRSLPRYTSKSYEDTPSAGYTPHVLTSHLSAFGLPQPRTDTQSESQ